MVHSQPIEGVIGWMRSLYEDVEGWMSSNAVGRPFEELLLLFLVGMKGKAHWGPGLHLYVLGRGDSIRHSVRVVVSNINGEGQYRR
jgi:hypothetical protein